MAAEAGFKHNPLDLSQRSLRLIDVLPKQRDGLIRCTVRHATHEPDLEFTAVSYEWGDVNSEKHTVYINRQRFEVRHNLFLFLDHLLGLYPGGYSNLWIDALAIDQDNMTEKNHQVRQMKHWYETASKTLIWLGPAAGGSDELFDCLHTLEVDTSGEPSSVRALAKLNREQYKGLQDVVLRAGVSIWQACGSLARRTYWMRIWTLQEILLAKWPSLVCGSRMCPWYAWAIAVDLILEAKTVVGVWAKGLHADSPAVIVCRQWFSNVDGVPLDSLAQLVVRFQRSECSDKHDKVYALLGLASDASNFPVKYECPLMEILFDIFTILDSPIAAADARALCKILHVEPSRHDLTTLLESASTQLEVDIVCDLFREVMMCPETDLWLLPYETKLWLESSPRNDNSRQSFEALRLNCMNKLPRYQYASKKIEWKVTSLRPVSESDIYNAEYLALIPLKCPCSSCWLRKPVGNLPRKYPPIANSYNFNTLYSIRHDDLVRELVDVEGAIFYRRIGDEMVYLATGVKVIRTGKPRYVLFYDPILLDSDVNLATTVRATLGQSLNLAMHRHVPEMTVQSDFPLIPIRFVRSTPSPDPISGGPNPMIPAAIQRSSKQRTSRPDWPLVRRAVALKMLQMLVRASGLPQPHRLEPILDNPRPAASPEHALEPRWWEHICLRLPRWTRRVGKE
ncbi:hypothetical protein PV04_09669 [Phialophora macrospora]|uniref:Heterokaryon incompatibility domain-containing protein n=1 Tax=Phialophora macrospora TaxID=1851006 RepID=A0A0D2FXW4_9EURO|nr:hypothetical protein PV04_09669 [Phialophora macrospora]